MTAEVAFAKTFLSVLDAKPIKLQSDYAADLRTLELGAPVRLSNPTCLFSIPSLPLLVPLTRWKQYTLPRQPTPMKKPDSASTPSAAPGSEPAAAITLKSLRNPPLDLSLPAQPLSTSILDLKQRVAKELSLQGVDKVRLLYKKKPCADSKSVKDVLGDETPGAGGVEFSVMVMGGVTPAASAEGGKGDVEMKDAGAAMPVAPGEESGLEVLGKSEFWVDLKGFLEQRVKDQGVADNAVTIFQAAWKERGGAS
ncbi:hypothetical protein MMC10_000025 [Thelotrema lepadinum]|nr:hypothetical protein [Thelotrema lepadinum]